MFPEPHCSDIEIFNFFGKFNFDFLKKMRFFFQNFSFSQLVFHYTNAIRSVRTGRGFDFPLVHCRSVGRSIEFEYVFSEFDARAEFATILAL